MSDIRSLDASTNSIRQAISMSVLRKAMHADQSTVDTLLKAGTQALRTETAQATGVGSKLDLYV